MMKSKMLTILTIDHKFLFVEKRGYVSTTCGALVTIKTGGVLSPQSQEK